jgi:predicted metal-binding membrane protein
MKLQSAAPAVFPRDRILVWAALAALTGLAWVYLAQLTRDMAPMSSAMLTPQMRAWGAADFALSSAQWVVMMVGMMLPSAAPMVLGLVAILRARPAAGPVYPLAGLFVAGYLAAWAAFSALATMAQWGLQLSAVGASPILGGALLVGAGLFQWTPLKNSCLTHCRSPFGFFLSYWRAGGWGALGMGVRHGVLCVGCCWLLMALMLLTGAMNLLWMTALTAFILIEKIIPGGAWVGRIAGLALAGWGAWLVIGALA